MSSKINCADIIRDHLNTMRDNRAKRPSAWDLFVFYIFPAVVAIAVAGPMEFLLQESSINFLATVFSIFVGLLLNLLVLIVGQKAFHITPMRKKVLEETFCNVSYSILICVILIPILFAAKALERNGCLFALSVFAYLIVGNFMLTLLMILKRVHTLLSLPLPVAKNES